MIILIREIKKRWSDKSFLFDGEGLSEFTDYIFDAVWCGKQNTIGPYFILP